jgi:peptidoglycan hydrolase CwlO-like protein
VNDLITHIVLVGIMLISLIITLLIINSYRKNSIKIYNKITRSDEISQDQLMTVEKMGKKLQEKFYSLDKQVDELLEKIEKFKENIKK